MDFPAHLIPAGVGFHLGGGVALDRAAALDRAIGAADKVLGMHGIVGGCREGPVVPGLPRVVISVARGPRRDRTGRRYPSPLIGTGVSDRSELARLAAIVEAIERYSTVQPPGETDLVRATPESVGDHAVALHAFGLRQASGDRGGRLGADPLSAAESVSVPESDLAADAGGRDGVGFDWAWAWSLTRRCAVLVPAVLAYSSLSRRFPNDLVAGSTTTGVATHVSVADAVLAALYEVIERDALMINWLARRSPPRIDLARPDHPSPDHPSPDHPSPDHPSPDQGGVWARGGRSAEELRALVRDRFVLPDIEFILLDVTADSGVPTIACLARSDAPGRAAVALGAACRLDPAAAARKALFEAAQTLHGCHMMGWDSRSVVEVGTVRTLEDRARFYAGAGGRALTDALAGSPTRVSLGDVGHGRIGDMRAGGGAGRGGAPGGDGAGGGGARGGHMLAGGGGAPGGERVGRGGVAGLPCRPGGGPAALPSPRAELDEVVERLRLLGLDVLVVDLTPSDVAAAGFRTVRVLVPGAVDIGADARCPMLGSPRIRVVPARLGWPLPGDAGLNLAPCPLS